MKKLVLSAVIFIFCLNFLTMAGTVSDTIVSREKHDQLVTRLRALKKMEGAFGPAYQAIYHSALPWYETWDAQKKVAVDSWMVSPEVYATELADALEQGHNFIAENPGGLFPLVFEKKLPDGKTTKANYWLSIPANFPEKGSKFPLIIGLHGSGWLGHKLSFVRGGKTGGRVFQVTPINEGGPWQLDFLNSYLDELLDILPIDPDHVYLEGHSLGAMGAWEWAMNNPERFAAISPRSGRGEPYRAIRLKNVPAWVIHGEKDNVVLPGFADQMVNAIQACGGSVKYTVLKGVEHNMPSDLDGDQITDWYLRQTRSHYPVPADPHDTLGINAAGYSKWEVTTLPAQLYWKSEELQMSKGDPMNPPIRAAISKLFKKASDTGELIDSSILQELYPAMNTMNLWLAVPNTLRVHSNKDSSAIKMDAHKVIRFYFRGELKQALEHSKYITKEVNAAGYSLSDRIWVTQLSLWNNSPTSLSEYCLELK